jgi:hypothetical protein
MEEEITKTPPIILQGDLKCQSCEHGPCRMENNRKVIKDLGMPIICPYGLDCYADFTAAIIGIKQPKKKEQ